MIQATPMTGGDSKRQAALLALDILRKNEFDKSRPHPAEIDNHSVQTMFVAELICAGADLDVLAVFTQDFIYKKQSLLHLMAWAQPKFYANGNYALIERAAELLTAPGSTGTRRFDLDQIDGVWGFTPLHYAARFGSPRMVETLLEAGASLEVVSTGGMYPSMLPARTPLQVAQAEGPSENVQAMRAWQANKAIKGVLTAEAFKAARQQ